MPPSLCRQLVLAAIALCTAVPYGAVAQTAAASVEHVTIELDGRRRITTVYVPASYAAPKPVPLVLVFHGGGGNAENAERTVQMRSQADLHGLIVAYPNGTGVLQEKLLTWNTWNCCGYALQNNIDDIGFVRDLITALKRRYSIDASRIYATGISNGGMMTYRLACELSEQIAAIAPVAGALNTDSCKPRNPVSVVIFHGTADQHVLFEGGTNRKRFPGSEPRTDRSVEHAFTQWAQINNCRPQAPVRYAAHVKQTRCVDGTDGAEVVLYAIEDQGHAWPGGKPGIRNGNVDPPSREISATDAMIEFFLRHPKR